MTMQLHYQVTVDDVAARLQKYADGSVVGRRFALAAYLCICGLAWLSVLLFYLRQGDQNRAYLAYGLLAVLMTALLPRLYRWYQNAFWRTILTVESLRGVVGTTTLTVCDDCIEASGPMTTVRAPWHDVLRVERDSGRTYVFLAPLLAIVIPASAFSSEAARAEFEHDLQDRLAAHRSGCSTAGGR